MNNNLNLIHKYNHDNRMKTRNVNKVLRKISRIFRLLCKSRYALLYTLLELKHQYKNNHNPTHYKIVVLIALVVHILYFGIHILLNNQNPIYNSSYNIELKVLLHPNYMVLGNTYIPSLCNSTYMFLKSAWTPISFCM